MKHVPIALRLALGLTLLVALGLDIAGLHGHLGFVLPCTLFALLLLAVPWVRRPPTALPPLQLPAALAVPGDEAAAPAATSAGHGIGPGGETQLLPAPPPPLPGMMAVIDTEHRCAAASPALARWLGQDRDSLAGRSIAEVMGPLAAATLVPQIEAALGGALRRVRCPHQGADGSRRWLQVELQPRIDEFGERVGCDLLAMDVTPEHRRLEKLQRSERRLRSLLADSAAVADSTALADSTAIADSGAGADSAPGAAGAAPDTAADDADMAAWTPRPGRPLLAQVNDLLDLQALQAGRLQTDALDFDLGEVVEDAVQLLAPKAQAKGLELACRIDHRLPDGLHGDPFRLHQLITILLGNAVDCTARGEVLVEVQRAGLDALRVAVHDTGPGLSAAQQARLLPETADPEGDAPAGLARPPEAAGPGQGPQAATGHDAQPGDPTPGQGLGLRLARHLVALMGGRLGVESTLGQGSSFWFTLPLVVADTVAPMPPAAALAGRHVLVVDDNATQREVLEHLLHAAGLRCTPAEGEADALALWQAARDRGDPIELALIDLALRDGDGVGLATRLREQAGAAAPRTVLMTPVSAPGGLARARQAGIAAHVGKPARRQALYAALAQALGPWTGPATGPLAQPEPAAPSAGPAPATDGPAAGLPAPMPVVHARVLLADASGVNQVVTQSMLEALGCDCRAVSDGEAALEALRLEHFDLVLMDCDMPVLDGHATTRAIRLRERQTQGRHLPVIALTASALVSAIEPCHAAGMDDHLVKPYTRHQLVEVLQRWLPPALIEHPEAPAGPADATPTAGADAARAEAMRAFLEALPQRLQALRAQVDAGDARGLVPTAQTLAQASEAVGAGGLATLCHQLEQMGAVGDLTGAAGRVAALEAMADCIAPTLDDSRRLVA